MMVRVAPDASWNGCAGLIIAMGGGEDREHAGSVDGDRMAAREPRAYLSRVTEY